jgi:BirA family biotin operon repressor/biotin-[acetyl-CoA-carboxylase] ligase
LSLKFDQSVFQQQLNTQWLGRSFSYFKELESTNTYLKKLPAEKIEHGMVCLTDDQTQGRGQYKRKWDSEPGQNLTFSLAFTPSSADRLHVLTLACALASVQHLNNFFGTSCTCIKWPNDVLLNDKKVAGILTETVFSGNRLGRLIIGIGINVNQEMFTNGLKNKATSVRLALGEKINREAFLSNLLGRIEYNYNLWHRRQADLLKSINKNIRGYGRWIKLKVDDVLWDDTYKLLGINESGKLLMLDHDGGIESFSYEQIRLIAD